MPAARWSHLGRTEAESFLECTTNPNPKASLHIQVSVSCGKRNYLNMGLSQRLFPLCCSMGLTGQGSFSVQFSSSQGVWCSFEECRAASVWHCIFAMAMEIQFSCREPDVCRGVLTKFHQGCLYHVFKIPHRYAYWKAKKLESTVCSNYFISLYNSHGTTGIS